MGSRPWNRLQELFCGALERSPGDRADFLDFACGCDGSLRDELEVMLAAHEHDPLAIERLLGADDEGAPGDLVGRRLGPWQLTSMLGRGGSAEVYVGERADGHFRQRVAVKVVQGGWNPAGLARRLEIEREILASLRHPAIASLVDGGVTDDGRPYLVTELIEGEPITDDCDRRRLSIDQRLALFVRTCRAVQHAHGALIVHRDLKPSNILVTPSGEPKLLDFGIAKLLDADRFDLEVEATRFELRLLTPLRAAPEQFTGAPITTATDVWGLGVLLYELLTGVLPHGESSFTSSADLERLVCGRPARSPSSAIRELDDATATSVAEQRDTRPARLRRRLRGDLDRIVALALRLEPARRYASVGQLADDVERVLANEPITARPEGWAYRAGRFIRRHRVAVGVASIASALLIVATAVTAIQSRAAAVERDRAAAERDRAETVVSLLLGMLEQADPVEGPGGDTLSVAALLASGEAMAERLTDRPELQATLRATLGRIHAARSRLYDGRRLLESALATYEVAGVRENQALIPILDELGRIAAAQDRRDDARALLGRALALAEKTHGPQHPTTARLMQHLALHGEDDPLRQELLARRALEIWDNLDGNTAVGRASAFQALGRIQMARGDRAGARESFREARRLSTEFLGSTHPDTLSTMGNLANVSDDPSEVIEIRRTILEANTRRFGDTSVPAAVAWNNLGTSLAGTGRLDEARAAFLESLDRWKALHGRDHPQVANTARNVGRVATLEARYEEALAYLNQAVEIMSSSESAKDSPGLVFLRSQRAVVLARIRLIDDARNESATTVSLLRSWADRGSHRYLGEALVNLGLVQLEANENDEAAAAFDEAADLLEAQYGRNHPKTVEARCGRSIASRAAPDETADVCRPLAAWGLSDPVLRRRSRPPLEGPAQPTDDSHRVAPIGFS
jgi:serine/threonine-protein kinase